MKPRSILLWLAFAGLLYASPPATAQLPSGISGAWYNPAQSGHGLSVELHSPTKAIVFWMVYDPDGNPVHLYIDASVQGQSLGGPAYLSRGMRFGSFDRKEHQFLHWGEVNIKFLTCRDARLSYDASGPAGEGYGEGQLPLQRLLGIAGLPCEGSSEYVGLYDGSLTAADGRNDPVVAMLGRDGRFHLAIDGQESDANSSVVAIGSHQWWGDRYAPMQFDLLLARAGDEPVNPLLPLLNAHGAVLDLASRFNNDTQPYEGDLQLSDGREYALRLELRNWSHFERAITLAGIAGEYRQTAGIPGSNTSYALSLSVSDVSGANVHGLEFRGPEGSPPSCRLLGQLRPHSGQTVELGLDLQLADCGERTGHYRGQGWVEDLLTVGDNRRLQLIATTLDFRHALRFTLIR